MPIMSCEALSSPANPSVAAGLPASAPVTPAPDTARTGVACAIAAYGLWGLFPLYFKAVGFAPPFEVLCHRVVWSVPILALLTTLAGSWSSAVRALRDRTALLTLTATTVLIGANWLIFVWSIANHHLMQASLGYFINPLVNVLLGFIFLRERLRRGQQLSVLLAAVGVAYLTFAGGTFPVIALSLATTFGVYGLLRKVLHVDAIVGLTIETSLLLPFLGGYLAYLGVHGTAAFTHVGLGWQVLLMLAGPVTALPLLLFAAAAKRLRLATMGFIQYLAPTGHFLLAVAFGEHIRPALLVAFLFIWTALVIYTVDAARRARPNAERA